MNKHNDLISIIRLIRSENVGNITFFKLVEMFGSATSALERLPHITKAYGKKIKVYPLESATKEIELAKTKNISIITYLDDAYPPLLKQLPDCPPILFVKGHQALLKKIAIAIVGSRNASLNGQQQAFNFAQNLGDNGFLIVSGMAKGIDSSAHQGALAKGTIAVLGGGVDIIYPTESTKLYHNLCDVGAMISEFPIGTQPIATNFPRRNRIITGIARAVLIVEANLNSGSLISANYALEQGKDVFAIPGSPTDARSKGTNKLIKEGAILTENVFDIINNLQNFKIYENKPIANTNTMIQSILNEQELIAPRKFVNNALSTSPISVDALIRESEFSYQQIATILLELELIGKLERFPNNQVALLLNNTIKTATTNNEI